MHVLLTRPHTDSQTSQKILQQKNISSAIQPVFEIVPHDLVIPARDYQAIILTSRHSASAAAAYEHLKNIPTYCVGNHTAQHAKKNNFKTVFSADGNAVDLSALIRKNLKPQYGPVLRLTGYPAGDFLSAELKTFGYEIDILQSYHSDPVSDFSNDTIDLLNQSKLNGVLFFSPQSAAHFYTLLTRNNLAHTCRTLTAWCISNKTALALKELPFETILIAARPTHKDLIDLIPQTE